jgi:arabinofuranan 3-O-arabinosyltransferase
MGRGDLDSAAGDTLMEPPPTTSEHASMPLQSRASSLRGIWSAARGTSARLGRIYLLVIFLCFLAVCFAQAPGLIQFDTSLPVVLSPVSYFGTFLHLWNPTVFGGTMVQGAGFLVPQGLFFIGTHLLHVPPWVAQRIWLATLMTIGAWGVIRLAEALGIGHRWARVLAGAAYCVAPLMVVWVTTTGDMLAVVLLPWVLVPLVAGSRAGSTRQAAARSGIAIALMGGSNASLVLAVLAVAVIWLLTRQPGPRRRALCLWWIVSVAMACFFWAVALLFTGHFGYNYLPFTETSVTTTSTASVFEAVRGASAWTAYYTIPRPLLAGAWILVSRPVVIAATALLAALGLAGLCRRIPERLFLVSSLAFGVVVISSGYSGHLGAPFAGTVQHLLQNSLAPFRNISKFAPAVMLPLALGLAWTL